MVRRPILEILTVALALTALAAAAGCRPDGETTDSPAAAGAAASEDVVRRFYRGLAHLEVGQTDAAAEELREATRLAPDEPAAWANLALAHLRLGSLEAAGAALERAAELAPDNGRIAFLEARLATARGLRDESIEHLRRAVELDPDDLPVRMALVQEVENSGLPEADDEAQRLLEELVARRPDNVAVLVERARLAAKRSDADLLRNTVERLGRFVDGWPEAVAEQYRGLERASEAGDFAAAARATAFLRNVLVQVPAFVEARRRVTPPQELIAEPFTGFLELRTPPADPAAPDLELTFARQEIEGAEPAEWTALLAASRDGELPPTVFAADADAVRRLDGSGLALPLPGAAGLVALDWNHDFRPDLLTAGAGGVRLFLQSEDGAFTDATATTGEPFDLPATDVWAADVEMDGDLDAVVGVRDAEPVVLRNHGDGTWQPLRPFAGVSGVRQFVWGDLDADGDPDAAFLDAAGSLHVFSNLQAGRFERLAGPPATDVAALTLAEAEGRLGLVVLAQGTVRRVFRTAEGWTEEEWARWPEDRPATPGERRLLVGDLDNNGALDLTATGPAGTAVWLAGQARDLQRLETDLAAEVFAVTDFDGDGGLDLLGLEDARPVRLLGRRTRGYHFYVVRPRAQRTAGDQRINSFGIGGTVEARAGRLVQKRSIDGPVVHFGLGERDAVDVTWIVWPNGIGQAEFDLDADHAAVAEQRLKGSCPWVFADDGSGMSFVTDFLWRSPLGLRINAHDTAGVTQTEDWVKIRGDQLAARDGAYDVRITGELWETLFFDHVSLLVVDHPADVEVFVDERFVPTAAPALAVHALAPPKPVARAWDQDGREVTELVARRDGRFLATFDRGRYQGIAEDHFVEVELAAPVPPGVPAWLVAHGWIYPTDSSINVAIAQGGAETPRSLSLEARTADGDWVVVAEDLGFPAGKRKTVLLDLGLLRSAGLAGATRLRLRTNLEIYWDSLASAVGRPDARLETRRLEAARAELRYRGFSVTRYERDLPEIPVYDRLANTSPRWRDLVGHYTRFGDVRELLARVEDRYVIMNAGDELRLSFAAPEPPPEGMVRDFVLVGDGWVKDGDFNTSHSKTVVPLPAHGDPVYDAPSSPPMLFDDPVFARHPEDWVTYHTRFIEPPTFLRGLGLSDVSRPR